MFDVAPVHPGMYFDLMARGSASRVYALREETNILVSGKISKARTTGGWVGGGLQGGNLSM